MSFEEVKERKVTFTFRLLFCIITTYGHHCLCKITNNPKEMLPSRGWTRHLFPLLQGLLCS